MTKLIVGKITDKAVEAIDSLIVSHIDVGHTELESIMLYHPKSRQAVYLRDKEMAEALIAELQRLLNERVCWSCVP